MSSWDHWRRRIANLAKFHLREFSSETQVRILEPLLLEAGKQLRRAYPRGDRAMAEVALEILDIKLKTAAAVEKHRMVAAKAWSVMGLNYRGSPVMGMKHDDVNWRQAKTDTLADKLAQLSRNGAGTADQFEPETEPDMRHGWRARVLEISYRWLRQLPHEEQGRILRPLARELGDKLWQCWCSRDQEAGEFEVDRFELKLRRAIEEHTSKGIEQRGSSHGT